MTTVQVSVRVSQHDKETSHSEDAVVVLYDPSRFRIIVSDRDEHFEDLANG
jgi:hypothetical protein